MPEVVLSVEHVGLSFGAVRPLDDVSFEVQDRELLAIIGPNGAGKTALLNCITGFYRPQGGRLRFLGKDLLKLPSHGIAAAGIARTFQNLALYPGASALDNLLTGRHLQTRETILAQLMWFGPSRREEIRQRLVVEEIIDFLEIESARYALVDNLPYGMRKRIELGRALAMEPRLLLLDEPMAGMNREEKEDIARFILDVHQLRRIPIVFIEHDMGLVMDIAQRVIVLDQGRKIADGPPSEIKTDPWVVRAYLGGD